MNTEDRPYDELDEAGELILAWLRKQADLTPEQKLRRANMLRYAVMLRLMERYDIEGVSYWYHPESESYIVQSPFDQGPEALAEQGLHEVDRATYFKHKGAPDYSDEEV